MRRGVIILVGRRIYIYSLQAPVWHYNGATGAASTGAAGCYRHSATVCILAGRCCGCGVIIILAGRCCRHNGSAVRHSIIISAGRRVYDFEKSIIIYRAPLATVLLF